MQHPLQANRLGLVAVALVTLGKRVYAVEPHTQLTGPEVAVPVSWGLPFFCIGRQLVLLHIVTLVPLITEWAVPLSTRNIRVFTLTVIVTTGKSNAFLDN